LTRHLSASLTVAKLKDDVIRGPKPAYPSLFSKRSSQEAFSKTDGCVEKFAQNEDLCVAACA
jgi:hypothetical protein